MSGDRLLSATLALRASRTGASPTADVTEARILAQAQQLRRRRTRAHWLWLLALLFTVALGLAAARPGVRHEAAALWSRVTSAR